MPVHDVVPNPAGRRLAAIRRMPLRLHMAVMLCATLAAGIAGSKLLLVLGLDDVLWRYPLIVLLSYAVFFAAVKLWLIVFAGARLALFDPTGVAGDLPLPGGGGGGGAGGGVGGGGFGGGSFGGGGASSAFQPVALPVVDPGAPELPLPAVGSGGGGGSSSGAGDLLDGLGSLGDDDSGVILVLIALAALLFAVFGAGAVLVYHAPAILGEAAFNTLLAAGLYRRAHAIGRPGWAGSVFRATRWPFAGVLVVSAAAGWVMHHYLPAAHRVADVVRILLDR